MADRSAAWQTLLYQFAACLTGNPDLARRIVLESLDSAIQRPPAHADAERRIVLQFQQVRRAILKTQPGGSPTRPTRDVLPAKASSAVAGLDFERISSAVRVLSEPGRSGLLLLLLDVIEADEAAKLLGLSKAEFSDAVHTARVRLHQLLSNPQEVAQ